MNRYRCTACGTITTSARACPKCGRRSTLVPVEESAPVQGDRENQPTGSSRDAKLLFAAVAVAVISSVTALVIALGRSDKHDNGSPATAAQTDRSARNTEGPGPRTTTSKKAPPRPAFRSTDAAGASRPTTMNRARKVCGIRYCLTTELRRKAKPDSASDRKAGSAGPETNQEGTLVTTHCFLTEQAPSPDKMWYVVTSHRLQWKRGTAPARDILKVTHDETILAPHAERWLGELARAFRTDASPVGKRLFYLRRTKWGFALASPPTAPDPVRLQMALLAATASALVPSPPSPQAESWTDSRPLLLPVPAPHRLWHRTTRPGSKLVRWSIEAAKKAQQPSADGQKGRARQARRAKHPRQGSGHRNRDSMVQIRGVAQAMDGHMDKAQLDWSTSQASGRLLLMRFGEGCLDDDEKETDSPKSRPAPSRPKAGKTGASLERKSGRRRGKGRMKRVSRRKGD